MRYSSPAAFLSPIPAIEVNLTKPAGNRNSILLRSDISDFAALRYFWGWLILIPPTEGIKMRTPERSALCDPCKRGSISERLAPHHNGGVTGASAYASHQFSEFLASTGPPSVGAVPPGRNKLMPRGEPWLTQFLSIRRRHDTASGCARCACAAISATQSFAATCICGSVAVSRRTRRRFIGYTYFWRSFWPNTFSLGV